MAGYGQLALNDETWDPEQTVENIETLGRRISQRDWVVTITVGTNGKPLRVRDYEWFLNPRAADRFRRETITYCDVESEQVIIVTLGPKKAVRSVVPVNFDRDGKAGVDEWAKDHKEVLKLVFTDEYDDLRIDGRGRKPKPPPQDVEAALKASLTARGVKPKGTTPKKRLKSQAQKPAAPKAEPVVSITARKRQAKKQAPAPTAKPRVIPKKIAPGKRLVRLKGK